MFLSSRLVVLAIGLIALPALADEGKAGTEPADAHAANHRTHAQREAEHIHELRLRHLAERQSTTPESLHQNCRFESAIGTVPPKGQLALSFDDGPDPAATPHILEVLGKHHAPATFFMIGEQAQRHPDLVAQVRAHGEHLIGNHTWSHPNFHEISLPEQSEEIQKAQALLTPNPEGRWYRYPYGNSTCDGNALLHLLDYRIVGWHIDSCDWAFDRNGEVDAQEALECGVLPQYRSNYVEHVVSAARAHNGGIVLMHEIHPNTVRQLDEVLTALESAGFVFVRLDEPAFEPDMR